MHAGYHDHHNFWKIILKHINKDLPKSSLSEIFGKTNLQLSYSLQSVYFEEKCSGLNNTHIKFMC